MILFGEAEQFDDEGGHAMGWGDEGDLASGPGEREIAETAFVGVLEVLARGHGDIEYWVVCDVAGELVSAGA